MSSYWEKPYWEKFCIPSDKNLGIYSKAYETTRQTVDFSLYRIFYDKRIGLIMDNFNYNDRLLHNLLKEVVEE